MPRKPASIRSSRKRIINSAPESPAQPRLPPIDGISIIVIRHGRRITSEILSKYLQAFNYFLTRTGVGRRVMVSDFKALCLQSLSVLAVGFTRASFTRRIGFPQWSNRPNALCRAKTQIAQKRINVFPCAYSVAIGIIENGKCKALTFRPWNPQALSPLSSLASVYRCSHNRNRLAARNHLHQVSLERTEFHHL